MVERQAEGLELRLMPPGSQAEDKAPTAHVRQGRRLAGQLSDVPEGMTQDERAQRDPRCRRGDLREAEHRVVAEHTTTRPLDEYVVHHPDRVEADLLCLPRLLRDVGQGLRPVGPIVVHLQRYADFESAHRRGYFAVARAAKDRFALSRPTRRRCVSSWPAAGFQIPLSTIAV